MVAKNKGTVVFLLNSALLALLLLLRSTGLLTLKLYGASPLLPLSLLVALGIFAGELPAFFAGLFIGIFLDSVTSCGFGFNALTLMLVGLFSALISNHIFNKNLRAALALCLICSLFYFAVRWIICDAATLGFYENSVYFLCRVLPSAVYTAVFVIPFYFLEKRLFANNL